MPMSLFLFFQLAHFNLNYTIKIINYKKENAAVFCIFFYIPKENPLRCSSLMSSLTLVSYSRRTRQEQPIYQLPKEFPEHVPSDIKVTNTCRPSSITETAMLWSRQAAACGAPSPGQWSLRHSTPQSAGDDIQVASLLYVRMLTSLLSRAGFYLFACEDFSLNQHPIA